jgi:hypothetical protein
MTSSNKHQQVTHLSNNYNIKYLNKSQNKNTRNTIKYSSNTFFAKQHLFHKTSITNSGINRMGLNFTGMFGKFSKQKKYPTLDLISETTIGHFC